MKNHLTLSISDLHLVLTEGFQGSVILWTLGESLFLLWVRVPSSCSWVSLHLQADYSSQTFSFLDLHKDIIIVYNIYSARTDAPAWGEILDAIK